MASTPVIERASAVQVLPTIGCGSTSLWFASLRPAQVATGLWERAFPRINFAFEFALTKTGFDGFVAFDFVLTRTGFVFTRTCFDGFSTARCFPGTLLAI